MDGPDGMPAHVERTLSAIEHLNELIADMDRELQSIAKGNELLQRLMSVPGVGPVTAIRFVAAIDDIERFRNAHALQSYVGLTPGERSSGKRVCRTGITKAGPTALRAALVQAAWSARNSRKRRNDPMLRWMRGVEERRGKQVAAVALARKIAGILYAIWRDGTRYDASRGADKSNG
jgi:transposase